MKMLLSGVMVPLDRLQAELRKDLEENEYRYYGKDMYALLERAGDYYQVERISLEEPEAGIYLKCRFNYLDRINTSDPEANFTYNLDKYFVPENTGLELEELSREGRLIAEIRVYKGYPLLTGVYPAE